MDPQGFSYHLTEWIESLPDRPFMLLLFIMGGAMLFMLPALLLGKLAQLAAGKTASLLGGADEEMAKLGAMVYGGANENGRINGVPARFTTGPVTYNLNIIGYEAEFTYTVANSAGLKLVIHRAGPLQRPLEFLPPEVPAVPESLKAGAAAARNFN